MLRNCEKMVLISSTPNEWPQPQHHHQQQQQQQQNIFIDDPKTTFNSVMDHPKSAVTAQDQQHQKQQQQQQQEALRCPRCDSTNTKFCYYNNYSLTQPRHFCKACKRYWTRGGTLRNVPVGGGCRKNKRVKRPTNSSITSSSCTSVEVNSGSGGGGGGLSSLSHGGVNNSSHIQDLINGSSAATNHHNHNNHPLFYGLPTNHSTNPDINFPFSRYDLQHPPQINGVGLGFSSTGLVQNMNTMNIHHNNHKPQIFRDLISQTTSNPTTTTTTAVSPSISSLLASMKGVHNNFQTLLPSYEDDLHLKSGVFAKDVKMEFENHRSDQNHWSSSNNNNHQMDQNMCSSSDPSSILWGNTAPNFSAWLDPSNNLGSSVPSLI